MNKKISIGELNNLDVYRLGEYKYVHMRDHFYNLDCHYTDSYYVSDYCTVVEFLGRMEFIKF